MNYINISAFLRVFISFLVLLVLSSSLNLFAQVDSTYTITENAIETLLEESETESENEDTYELLEDLIRNPVDLNLGELIDFQRIPDLNAFYSTLILEHRKKFGAFFSVDEIDLIEGLPKELRNQIKPFLTVNTPNISGDESIEKAFSSINESWIKNLRINLRSRIINDLQERRGFSEQIFEGTQPKIYNRLLLKYGGLIEAGAVSEKDAGEKSLNEFTSFHAALKNYGAIKILAAGDYTLEFGQGLALWSPYALSKGSDAIYSVKRKGKAIRPYKSTNENNFFRGIAASIEFNSFTFSGFYSRNYFDANIDSISRAILSTPIDGFHRTQTEISKKRSAYETFLGASVDYLDPNDRFKIGALAYNTKFSHQFFYESPLEKSGDNFSYYSFYYDFYFDRINIFGESAYDGRSAASVIGASIFLNSDLSFITLFRNYPRNYRNIHSFGFGEMSGNTKNEVGIYTGIKWKTVIGELNFYFDQFKFPFSTFSNPLPSNGNEFLIDLRSKFSSKIITNLRFKYEKKEVTEKIENIDAIVPRLRQSIRGEVIYEVSKQLRLKNRLEYNNFNIKEIGLSENGFMIFQDIRFVPLNNLAISTRIAFFQTDSFNSAIYEYENDLQGILSNVALYGEGLRWYFMIRYKPANFISLYAKYSETFKPSEKKLGSGYSEINNNVDNRLSFQAEIIF